MLESVFPYQPVFIARNDFPTEALEISRSSKANFEVRDMISALQTSPASSEELPV
jgi:hypothetical protein